MWLSSATGWSCMSLPQDFVLDGRAGFRKPTRGVCSRLEANVHLVTASVQEHQALIAAAHLAHLPVEETVFEPMAAAYACVGPEERARGVAIVDIGLESSGLVVYDGEKLILASSIPGYRRSLHARYRLDAEGRLTRMPKASSSSTAAPCWA